MNMGCAGIAMPCTAMLCKLVSQHGLSERARPDCTAITDQHRKAKQVSPDSAAIRVASRRASGGIAESKRLRTSPGWSHKSAPAAVVAYIIIPHSAVNACLALHLQTGCRQIRSSASGSRSKLRQCDVRVHFRPSELDRLSLRGLRFERLHNGGRNVTHIDLCTTAACFYQFQGAKGRKGSSCAQRRTLQWTCVRLMDVDSEQY